MTFGERITSLRKRHKWSQVEVAQKRADELHVTMDRLSGGSDPILGKALAARIQDIEKLSSEGEKHVYRLIDRTLGYHKIKQTISAL